MDVSCDLQDSIFRSKKKPCLNKFIMYLTYTYDKVNRGDFIVIDCGRVFWSRSRMVLKR